MNRKPLWTKDYISVCLSSFFVFITFYILLTSLPIYVLDHLHGTDSQIGLVVTAFLLSAILCRPFSGKWIEDFGRKKMLWISLTIFLASTVLYVWIESFPLLLLLRFIHGFGFGMVTTVLGTIVADLIPDQRRGEGMGYYAMAMNLAMVAGPFIGLFVAQRTDFIVVFYICITASVLAAVFAYIARFSDQSQGAVKLPPQKMSFRSLFEVSTLKIAFIAGVLSLAYSALISFISVYAKGLGLEEAASYFFVVYAAAIIISRPFTGKLFDLKGENIIIYPGIILFAVGLVLLSQADTTASLLISGAVVGLGFGSITPSFQAVAINKAAPHRRGAATATYFTLFDGGFALGSFSMGMLAATAGYSMLYLYCAGIAVISLPLYHFLHGRRAAAERTAAE